MSHKLNTYGLRLIAPLRVAAVGQIMMVAVNFGLVSLLRGNDGLGRWPAAVRELFVVHLLCISLMILSIALLTLRFVHEIASQAHPICRWLAGAAALFWLCRGCLQLFYSWSTQWPISQLHGVMVTIDGCLVLIYGLAAWRSAQGCATCSGNGGNQPTARIRARSALPE